MAHRLVDQVEQVQLRGDALDFRVGDTVDVATKIKEGDKERVQVFTGTVIMRKGSGLTETFTVRRIVNNEGVERIFPVHSPLVASVSVRRSGRTRRAKLFYLRQRVGKAVRLKEVRRRAKGAPVVEAAPAEGGSEATQA